MEDTKATSFTGEMNLIELEKEVKEKCSKTMAKVMDCKNDIECTTAAIAHYACMGEIFCPKETKQFQKYFLPSSFIPRLVFAKRNFTCLIIGWSGGPTWLGLTCGIVRLVM